MTIEHIARGLASALSGLVVVAALSPGHAQPAPERYRIELRLVVDSCQGAGVGLKLDKATLTVSRGKKRVTATMSPVGNASVALPPMSGKAGRPGKLRVASKKSPTAVEGVVRRFTASGKAGRRGVELVFVAEYFRGDKPMCAQSWNVTGRAQ